MAFYLLMSMHKMSKHYKKWILNPLSSLFHHGIIQILLLSHLAEIGDTWEDFLCRNNFSLPEKPVNSPLHSNINPNPCNPMTESQGVDLHRDHELTEPIYVAMQNPLGQKPRYNFVPKKSLEEVVDVLKERVSHDPTIESTQGLHDKSTVKKNRKKKKHGNSDLSFINKRQGRLISRSLRNQQQEHLSSISVIEVDDHLTNGEINDFLAREDVDNQGLRNEIFSESTQYDFVSKLPPFLKDQKGFAGIGHDLKQATGKTEAPIVEYT
jgi:hypothetical protein